MTRGGMEKIIATGMINGGKKRAEEDTSGQRSKHLGSLKMSLEKKLSILTNT